MLVAAVQMTSGPDVAANLEAAGGLLAQCAEAGAAVAVLPENFAFMGLRDADKLAVAEQPGSGPIQDMLSRMARSLGIWVVGGTLPLRMAGEPRVAAASLVHDAAGRCVARYDKMHLFDVDIPGRAESYRESAQVAPGASAVVVDTPAGRLGMGICYDVRFPELFRALLSRGAEWFALPAAFTVPTGRAHWDLLLRARAVENLAPVVAAAQTGFHPGGRETYGHSLVIDHWGSVLARRPRGPGIVVAAIDREAQQRARREFPALDHRRI